MQPSIGTPVVQRHKAALRRAALSRPVALALADGLISTSTPVLDFGCGRGDDLRHLTALAIPCQGWDPVHRPAPRPVDADVVNLGYVVNVIESARERAETLKTAWAHARTLLIVSARLEHERVFVHGEALADGVLTRTGTFQKLYAQDELKNWIEGSVGVSAVAAAPGVFYVFRQEAQANAFLARRHLRPKQPLRPELSAALFEHHADLLRPLTDFIGTRGRRPRPEELPEFAAIQDAFGSIERAFRVISTVTGTAAWDAVARQRAEDLLVFLTLARFGRRPKFSELPGDVQWDIKDLGGSYREACDLADRLLVRTGSEADRDAGCRNAGIGKLTPDALYVHVSALDLLPPLLRVYEGCARVLAGAVEGVTLVKFARDKAQISYLVYPDFDGNPHPALASGVIVALSNQRIHVRSYADSPNPPVLHRKELFVRPDYPLREKFVTLTRQEERFGLLAEANTIGTRDGWQRALDKAGVRLRGHRVVRVGGA